MKRILSIILITAIAFACNKNYNKIITDNESADVVTSVAYQYNTATKKLMPQDSIVAQISSSVGVKLVYAYLMRSDKPDSVVNIFYPSATASINVAMGVSSSIFSKINMSTVKGLKLMIKHTDNSYHQDSIKITSFTPPLPSLQNFPSSLLPNDNGIVHITGKAMSDNGIKAVYIYDDATGSFTKVDSIVNLNNTTSYDVNYNYNYRDKAANVKVQLVDNYNLIAETTIKVPLLPYTVYKDVTMNAQGIPTANGFTAATGALLNSCDLPLHESDIDLLLYGSTDNTISFYNPGNAANIAKNYKCNGTAWTVGSDLNVNKVKILLPGSSNAVDNLYANFSANNISDLDESGFFANISVPNSNTAKVSANAADLNPNGAYLLWFRVPKADGTFRNCLLRVKSFVASAASSSVTFDIYVQK